MRTTVTAPGFAPGVWAPTLRRAPALRLPRRMTGTHVLVAAAHADDETLGAGGLISALRSRGARFTVLVATDGAAAFPGRDGTELARVRRLETHAALAELGIRAGTHFLDLPDGRAADHVGDIADALKHLEPDLVLAPWRHDPHPDHRAVGEAAAEFDTIEYPVWMRHSMNPNTVARENLRVLRLTRGQARRKHRAIQAHRSQITVWADDHQPVLPGYVTALFRDGLEPFFVGESW